MKMRHRLFAILFVGLVGGCAMAASPLGGSSPVPAESQKSAMERDPQAIKRAAAAFEKSGQYRAALNLYLQLSAQYPDDTDSVLGVARCLIQTGQVDEGITQLETLRRNQVMDEHSRATLFNAYLENNKLERGADFMATLVADGTATPEERRRYGIILEILDRPDEARLVWGQLSHELPNDSQALHYIAISFALDRQTGAAVALTEPLLESPESDRLGRKTLMYIYALSGELAAAVILAEAIFTPQEAAAQKTLLTLLPALTRREQATAILLNRIASDTLRRLTEPASPP